MQRGQPCLAQGPVTCRTAELQPHATVQRKAVGCITAKWVRKVGACCANTGGAVWEVRWTEATSSAAVLEQENLYFHF